MGKRAKPANDLAATAIQDNVTKAVANRPLYACTHGFGVCLRWKWDDGDQYWTIPSGTCACSACTLFLDQSAHALTLASALAKAKAE